MGDLIDNLDVYHDGNLLDSPFSDVFEIQGSYISLKLDTDSLEAQGIAVNDNLTIDYSPRDRDIDIIRSVDGTFADKFQATFSYNPSAGFDDAEFISGNEINLILLVVIFMFPQIRSNLIHSMQSF